MPILWLEVVCVTGLPARTARPFVPSFFGSELQWRRSLGQPLEHFRKQFELYYFVMGCRSLLVAPTRGHGLGLQHFRRCYSARLSIHSRCGLK